MSIRIKKVQFEEIIAHCRREYPKEACGILAGEDERVTRVYEMTNTSGSPATCYFMDPQEQFKVFKEMRNAGVEMIGIYHSHAATGAYPSERDREMAFYPEASYVIVSLANSEKPEVRAFKLGEGKIEEEEFLITGST